MSTTNKSMIIVSSIWGESKTFRLMPISNDCPYSEGIYDPQSKVLVIMSKTTKESFHLLPKLDDNGDPIASKVKRPSGVPYREERKAIETFQEYYVPEKAEIINIVEMFAVNADTYDFKKFLEDSKIIKVPEKKIEILQP